MLEVINAWTLRAILGSHHQPCFVIQGHITPLVLFAMFESWAVFVVWHYSSWEATAVGECLCNNWVCTNIWVFITSLSPWVSGLSLGLGDDLYFNFIYDFAFGLCYLLYYRSRAPPGFVLFSVAGHFQSSLKSQTHSKFSSWAKKIT